MSRVAAGLALAVLCFGGQPAHKAYGADLVAMIGRLTASCFVIRCGADEVSPPGEFSAVPDDELDTFRQEAAHAYALRLAITPDGGATSADLPALLKGSAETLEERQEQFRFFRGPDGTGLLVSEYLVPDSLSYVDCLFWSAADPDDTAGDLLEQLRFFPRHQHPLATTVSVSGAAPKSEDGFLNLVSLAVHKPTAALDLEKWPGIVIWLNHEASK